MQAGPTVHNLAHLLSSDSQTISPGAKVKVQTLEYYNMQCISKVEYIAHLNILDVIVSYCTQTIHVYFIAFLHV